MTTIDAMWPLWPPKRQLRLLLLTGLVYSRVLFTVCMNVKWVCHFAVVSGGETWEEANSHGNEGERQEQSSALLEGERCHRECLLCDSSCGRTISVRLACNSTKQEVRKENRLWTEGSCAEFKGQCLEWE